MMQVKNNFGLGLLIGLIFPLLAYLFSEVFLHREIIEEKPGVPYLIAVVLNLIVMRYTYKAAADKTGSGIMIVTFLVLVLVFIFKIKLH